MSLSSPEPVAAEMADFPTTGTRFAVEEPGAPWIVYRWIAKDGTSEIVARGPHVRWSVPLDQLGQYRPRILACEHDPKQLAWLQQRLDETELEAREADLNSALADIPPPLHRSTP